MTTLTLVGCTTGSGTVATTTTAPTTTTVPETTTTTVVPMEAGSQLFVYTPEAGHCFDLRTSESGARLALDADASLRDEGELALLLDCAQPHQYEVAGLAEVASGAGWPGDEALEALAKRLCPPVFETWVGTSYVSSSLEMGWILPGPDAWGRGLTSVACLVFDPAEGLLTGTTQGSMR